MFRLQGNWQETCILPGTLSWPGTLQILSPEIVHLGEVKSGVPRLRERAGAPETVSVAVGQGWLQVLKALQEHRDKLLHQLLGLVLQHAAEGQHP